MAAPPIDLRALVATCGFAPEAGTKLANLLDAALDGSAGRPDAAAAAADGIDELCPRSEDAEGFLWSLWTLLVDVSKRIPLGDWRMNGLVEVVEKLKAKQGGSVEIWGSSSSLWADMPLLGPVMREAWDTTPEFDNNSPQQATTIAQWVSLNSFAARLLGSSVQSWTNFALWELRDALEEPPPTEQAKDMRLTTASEWIEHAGLQLEREGRKGTQLDEHDARALGPGSLLEGADSGFSKERWRFWGARLEELSAGASAETQERTRTALEVMLRLGLHHEAELVLQVGGLADGAVVLPAELLPVDALQHVDELLARAAQPRRRVVDVVLQRRDELLEERPVVRRRRRRVQRLQLALQQAEERRGVDGRGRGVRVVLRSLAAGGLVELVEQGEEGSHVDAAAGATGLGELDVVLDLTGEEP
ncbi:hypothetical protein Trco_004845 [Trichoderma cornu-damae]|uniref:Nuclear pore complex protein n=1 Tax=Trichoderma cornu-damae TaxID=654480 RepID=A0A9P8TV58_9HYPO|nr:hypothetical protein Trco_004845 [Trichoderma cornu-damae]